MIYSSWSPGEGDLYWFVRDICNDGVSTTEISVALGDIMITSCHL